MASTVVEGATSEKLRCKWIAEVEVNVMAKIRRAALSTAGPPRAQNRPAALLGSIVLSPTPPHNYTSPLIVRILHLSSRVVLSLTSLTSPHRSFFLLLHVVPPISVASSSRPLRSQSGAV